MAMKKMRDRWNRHKPLRTQTDRLSVGVDKSDQQAGRPRCGKPKWHLGLQGMFGSTAHKTFIFRVGLQLEVKRLGFLFSSLKTKILLVHCVTIDFELLIWHQYLFYELFLFCSSFQQRPSRAASKVLLTSIFVFFSWADNDPSTKLKRGSIQSIAPTISIKLYFI